MIANLNILGINHYEITITRNKKIFTWCNVSFLICNRLRNDKDTEHFSCNKLKLID